MRAFRVAAAIVVMGCGATTPPSAGPTAGTQDGGAASSSTSASAPLTPPAGVTLPNERAVPPVALGSKVAKVRGKSAEETLGDPQPPACAAKVAAGASGAIAVAALAKECSPGAKMVGGPHVAPLADAQGAAPVTLAAERGGCYRAFVAAEGNVEGFVVVVLDSKGSVAVEGRTQGKTLVVPAEGPLCFDATDTAKVLVSAARGSGRGFVQIARE